VIVVLGQEEDGVKFTGLKASKAACDLLGFRLVVDKKALNDTRTRVALMKKAVAELLVTSGDQRVRHQVLLEGSETVFELPLPRAPSRVVLDPGGWILKGDVR
jgi:hypothetical protein